MTSRSVRRLLFAAIAIAVASVAAVAVLIGADLYLHHRAEKSAGLNVWGYRGPVVGRKTPGEIRVVVLGGSTAFGYGVTWDQAFPALLERQLNATRSGPYRVVNLGYNSEGAYSFRFTLEDFAYLDYDVVCLYEGYNDIIGDGSPNLSAFRHDSPVFRLTGYLPILPLVFREKAMALRAGGNLDAAYRGQKVVFNPDLSVRMSAAVLDAAAGVGDSIEQQLAHVSSALPKEAPQSDTGCGFPWDHYCGSVARAADYALLHRKKVLIVGQPLMTSELTEARQNEQQAALKSMLERRFGGNSSVRYVDLRQAIDLRNRTIAPDGMHLEPEGNAIVAARLVAPILTLARGERQSSMSEHR